MVTNGYLLKKETAQKLKTYGVTRVQITIDGPKKIHDSRRPLINGRGTFKTILNNIKDSCDLLNISLRINVDKKNAPYTQEVLGTLEQEGLKNKISPYLGHVYPYTDICADVQKTCFRKEQFSFLEARFNLEMLEKGFTASSYPQDKGGFCTADSLHSMVVAPSGAIVKCWNNICDEEALIGHLLSRELSPKMHSNLCTWLAWDPFEKQTCIECEILPICMGGCPYIAFRKGLKDKGDCLDWKYNLKEMLSLYYLQKKKREEIEIANALLTQVEKLRKEIKKEQKEQATA